MAYINENNIAYGVLTEGAEVTDDDLLRAQRIFENNTLLVYNDGTYQVNPANDEIKNGLIGVYLPLNSVVYLSRYESHWYSPTAGVKARHICINSSPSDTPTIYGVSGQPLTNSQIAELDYIYFAKINTADWYGLTNRIADLEARITALES